MMGFSAWSNLVTSQSLGPVLQREAEIKFAQARVQRITSGHCKTSVSPSEIQYYYHYSAKIIKLDKFQLLSGICVSKTVTRCCWAAKVEWPLWKKFALSCLCIAHESTITALDIKPCQYFVHVDLRHGSTVGSGKI